jgi:hypothetical protein
MVAVEAPQQNAYLFLKWLTARAIAGLPREYILSIGGTVMGGQEDEPREGMAKPNKVDSPIIEFSAILKDVIRQKKEQESRRGKVIPIKSPFIEK